MPDRIRVIGDNHLGSDAVDRLNDPDYHRSNIGH